MKRRTLIIIISVLILVVGVSIWLYIRSTRTQEVTPEGVVTPVLGTEDVRLRLSEQEIAAGKTVQQKENEIRSAQNQGRNDIENVSEITVRKILDSKVRFATLDSTKDNILYYDPDQSEFFRSSRDGSGVEKITSAGFQNLSNAKWSMGKNAAILYFETSNNARRLFTFNFSNQTFNDLGNNVVEAALSPGGDQIVYLFVDEDNNVSNLSSAEADGTKWKILHQYTKDNALIEWTNPFRFIVGEEPTSYKPTSLVSFDISGEDTHAIVGDGFGVSYTVSPNGNNIIYTAGSPRSDELYLYATDINGSFHKDLEISTLAEKCAFAEDNITVYCGVPQRGNLDYVLPDDYLDGKMVTDDSFYRINIETGAKDRLAGASELGSTYDVYKPFVSPSGRAVYFTRKQDGRFYALLMP